MSVAWADLGSADFGVGAPLDLPLFSALEVNDEAGIDHVFQLDIPNVHYQNNVYAALWSVPLLIDQGTKTLRIAFNGYIVNASSGTPATGPARFKCTINGTLDSDEAALIGSNNGAIVLCTFLDVSAYRGQLVTLDIKARSNLTSEITSLQAHNYALCMQSWD